ncbi:hypothetical protein [Bradyrhizobium ivorense]|uniref:hypothetical protein n=1 Tax=Bradyrhizobium ivorense TaxID=2511166 RepID=UPI0010B0EAB7|nr:hypothetical protein [Bradyrhizobium ivorense]VIO77011.1 hypothetical protein CI41S_54020 [Bradyrhizobium ivorense]
MAGNDNGAAAGAQTAEEKKRFRSEIEFPYTDLESAVEVAKTINVKAGSSCDVEELAAWMGQSATGGTFRTRIGAAKMFGLIEGAQGRVTLTPLGHDVLDNSGVAPGARVSAFLNVELFNAMYEQFKARTLPPPPAIERQVVELGVSPKQKDRARQTFMKSAQYAGFIDSATGRFVKPGIVQREESAPEKREEEKRRDGGNDGNEPPGLHPFVQGLLKELPKAGDVWPEEKRKLWLDTAASIFKMIYRDAPSTSDGMPWSGKE